jgi:hypothetical protein
MLRTISNEYYGDNFRWFIGTVINSSPPYGYEGRVRVRIHGIHNPSTGETKEDDLPWAQVMIPLTEGGVSGHGRIPQVLPGALVYGFFLDGETSQIPIVLGSVARMEHPTDVQARGSNSKELSVYKSKTADGKEFKENLLSEDFKNDVSLKPNVSERRSQTVKFFIDNGYSVSQAAGIAAGLQEVSGFVTHTEENTEFYTGIGKWLRSGPRYRGLVQFSSGISRYASIERFSVQLFYVLQELRTTHTIANSKILRSTLIKSPAGSAQLFVKYYLKRPDLSVANVERIAENAYDEVIR